MPTILKRLRLKFMFTTTGIVAFLVIVIAAGFCINTYTSSMNEIEKTLERSVNSSAGIDRQGGAWDDGFPPENDEGNGFNNAPDLPDINGTGNIDSDQRIDIFRGRLALVYTVMIDSSGNVLRNDSPALSIDDNVLKSAISEVLSSKQYSDEEGAVTTGKLSDLNLFYRAENQNGNIYLGLTDASPLDERMSETILGATGLVVLAIALTIIVSFFLARLFLRPVEDAWNKQRRFIADASHELKTPLTVIMANTEIVRSSPDSQIKEEMKWLDGVMDESERMQGLIADLLLLARMDDEEGSVAAPAIEHVDFSELVEDSLMSFEAVAFERNLSIEESIQENLYVSGSYSRLSRLPDILIDNACKYAEPSGRIEVSLSKSNGQVVLRVCNTGSEIREEILDRLFDRFYRADESRSQDIPGYGLGLSIARSIVEESKGTIKAENVPGEGVAFTVTLPIDDA